MLPVATDTIAAVATPPGRGGVGIVRLSGDSVPRLAHALLGFMPSPRQAVYCAFRDRTGAVIDRGIALYFPAPASFTGQSVLELHGHGGPVLMQLLMREALAQGARAAEPGEFTQRAYLNGKLDLAQAEAIADLIDAETEAAARAAQRSLDGAFSEAVSELAESLLAVRVQVEAALDFSDEDLEDMWSPEALAETLGGMRERIAAIQREAGQGRLLRDGMTLVIAGPPNAGKSSLLNRLAGHDAAIVTDVAGTTRDVLRETVQVDGLPVHILDTAGLRETEDPVEQEGVRRAWEQVRSADGLLFIEDVAEVQAVRASAEAAETDLSARLPESIPRLHVCNKIDRIDATPRIEPIDRGWRVYLSAQTGSGVELLLERIKALVGFQPTGAGVYSARERHLEALRETAESIDRALALASPSLAGDWVAEELRMAHEALGTITGRTTPDALLGHIFSSFCIGK
jgi:tRNA modification GTPase